MSDTFMERQHQGGMSGVEEVREIAEIKGKMALARQFPRDETYSMSRIMEECKNPQLAEVAMYEYVRGDTKITGPSIRLVETVARHWGNLMSGVKEITRTDTEATVKAYAWDLESNFSDEKVFSTQLKRDKKDGTSYYVKDERDKYEILANLAARRKRACIQAVIPAYVFDQAFDTCAYTLENALKKGPDGEPLTIEVIRANMLKAFQKFADWITGDMLGERVGKEFDLLNAKDIVKLRNLYNSIKEGFVRADVAFAVARDDAPTAEEDDALAAVYDKIKKAAGQQSPDGEAKDEAPPANDNPIIADDQAKNEDAPPEAPPAATDTPAAPEKDARPAQAGAQAAAGPATDAKKDDKAPPADQATPAPEAAPPAPALGSTTQAAKAKAMDADDDAAMHALREITEKKRAGNATGGGGRGRK